LLLSAGLPQPACLTNVSVDFERQSAGDELRSGGWNPAAPTFFSWLGVVPYLTLEAFRSTVAFLAHQPTGSGVVFDYSQPRSVLPPLEQLAFDSLSARVALAGENFKLFFTPPQLASELAPFKGLDDLGAAELNARYFASRTDDLRLRGKAPRIVHAWV